MTGTPPNPTPTPLEKFFELLNQELITLGVPGGLGAVGVKISELGNGTRPLGALWERRRCGWRLRSVTSSRQKLTKG